MGTLLCSLEVLKADGTLCAASVPSEAVSGEDSQAVLSLGARQGNGFFLTALSSGATSLEAAKTFALIHREKNSFQSVYPRM